MIEYSLHRDTPKHELVTELLKWAGKYWFQIAVGCFLWQLYTCREVSTSYYTPAAMKASLSENAPLQAAFIEDKESFAKQLIKVERREKVEIPKLKSSDFKNLSFVLTPGLAEEKDVPAEIVQMKMKTCRKYVERFAATAISEQRQFGIPASITLAQGLLETDAGSSKIAVESNNHFGIKCRKKCRHCTCRNYSDDDAYDMFRVFETAWESFREHSKLLQSERYRHLLELGATDYKSWAKGLKNAGYATDKHYDQKLIQIIEALDLQQFDM